MNKNARRLSSPRKARIRIIMALSCVLALIIIATLVAFSVFVEHTHAELTRSNLKLISSALKMYYDQHQIFPGGEKTPIESLWLLYPNMISDERVYQNRRSQIKTSRKTGKRPAPAAWLKDTDFGYVEDCQKNCLQDIQVFERAAASGGRYVLLVNGEICWMNELEFQQESRKQTEFRQQTPMAPIFEVCPVILDRRKTP